MQLAYHHEAPRTEDSVRLSFEGYLQGGSAFTRGYHRETGEAIRMIEVFIATTKQGFSGVKVEGLAAMMEPAFLEIPELSIVRVVFTPVLSKAIRQGERVTQYQNNEFIHVDLVHFNHDVYDDQDRYEKQWPNDDVLDKQSTDPIDTRPRRGVY